MRWLIIQSDGEHKGQDGWEPNWFMRECYAIRHAMIQNGDEADIWGLRHANFSTTPQFESYDGLFVIENYETGWLPDFSRIKSPLIVQWIIDLHWQGSDAYLPISMNAHVVLHSTRHLLADYAQRASGRRHYWFPNGVDDRYFHAKYATRAMPSTPLLFIGGDPDKRGRAISYLQQYAGLVYKYGVTGMAYVHEILDCLIHWNMPIKDDVNYRNFETIGLGRCLLTQEHPELLDLGFRHGENCLLWRTLDECVELAKMTATNPGALLELGARAATFSKEHTYTKRYANLYHQLWEERLVPERTTTPPAKPA